MTFRLVVEGKSMPWQRTGRGRKLYTQEPTRDFKRIVATAAINQIGLLKVAGPLEVYLRFYITVPDSWTQKAKGEAIRGEILPTGVPDLDNLAKSVLDAMTQIVWCDDAQIVRLTIEKTYASMAGLVAVIHQVDALPAGRAKTNLSLVT